MKEQLLEYIACPVCGNKFLLKIFRELDGEVESGMLNCSCGQFFNITNFIPRIIVKEKMTGDVRNKKKTAESFGFEWGKFSQMRKEWQNNFNFYFEPANINMLKNKIVLELGCGNGRHTFYASKLAKEMFAVDLSSSVDIARINNKENKNIHFIQADIYNLPFKKNFFDFIFCLGVLHHLPMPREGFSKLIDLAGSGAGILIYVYRSFTKSSFNFYLLFVVNFFRDFIKNIPYRALYILCYPLAFFSYLVLVLPYKYLFRYFVKEDWPLGSYANYSLFVLLNDTFDRFSAPIENRYTKDQVLEWYKEANLKDTKILGGSGWRVFGIKN